jgi:hypothetical protein
MPFVKKTLTDCLQSLADRHESNGTLPTSSAVTSFWTRLLNKGVAYCADKLRLTKSTSLTTASGTIALHDDFLVRDSVFLGDQEYYQVDPQDEAQHIGPVYWITGNQTDGFYLNAPTDDTFTVNYSFKPVEMSATTDKCIIPDPEAVVAYAYSMIRKSESDPFEDADGALQECDARLKEIQSANAINNVAIGFDWN